MKSKATAKNKKYERKCNIQKHCGSVQIPSNKDKLNKNNIYKYMLYVLLGLGLNKGKWFVYATLDPPEL